MENTSTAGKTFLNRILYLLIILMGGLFATATLCVFIFLAINDFNLSVLNSGTEKLQESLSYLWLLQGLQSIFLFILPPFILCKIMHEDAAKNLHLRLPKISHALAGMGSIVVLMPLLNVFMEWNSRLTLPESMHSLEIWMKNSEAAAKVITDRLMAAPGVSGLLINLLIVAVFAGVGEELFFRGTLLKTLSDFLGRNKTGKSTTLHLSIWIIAILFSAIHMQFYGFVPRMLIGAWLGYLLWWTGSIWVPVLAHFTNNAISTIVMSTDPDGRLTRQMDSAGMNETWWLSLLSVAATIFLIRYFLRTKQNNIL